MVVDAFCVRAAGACSAAQRWDAAFVVDLCTRFASPAFCADRVERPSHLSPTRAAAPRAIGVTAPLVAQVTAERSCGQAGPRTCARLYRYTTRHGKRREVRRTTHGTWEPHLFV